MFDFLDHDPDDVAVEEMEEIEPADLEDMKEQGVEEREDTNILGPAIIAGALIGEAQEENIEQDKEMADTEKLIVKEQSQKDVLPLRALRRKKERNLPPFEQWVSDVIRGRKTLDDEL